MILRQMPVQVRGSVLRVNSHVQEQRATQEVLCSRSAILSWKMELPIPDRVFSLFPRPFSMDLRMDIFKASSRPSEYKMVIDSDRSLIVNMARQIVMFPSASIIRRVPIQSRVLGVPSRLARDMKGIILRRTLI